MNAVQALPALGRKVGGSMRLIYKAPRAGVLAAAIASCFAANVQANPIGPTVANGTNGAYVEPPAATVGVNPDAAIATTVSRSGQNRAPERDYFLGPTGRIQPLPACGEIWITWFDSAIHLGEI
jgi:hypothetical protein